MEVLGLVPARAGSKGLPGKNVRPFLGRPLLAWSVEAALRATTVSRVVLTTDSEEYAEVGRAAGAEVPFLRPAELAGDEVRDLPVFQHALAWLRDEEGYVPDLVVHLRPTSPIRPEGLIDAGVERLVARPDADSLRAVSPSPHPPYKMWRIEADTLVAVAESGVPEQHDGPRQALPETFVHTGILDVIRTPTITEMASMSGRVILPLVLPSELDADIDDEAGFRAALAKAGVLGLAEPEPEAGSAERGR
ncbi:MAG: acylneuraminate cytidylyltransferase family protein [Acidimicrobiales bacterium]|nr:acylneuraminate cytidylyltransferase family protein [Acidimicrobiales bacterium]